MSREMADQLACAEAPPRDDFPARVRVSAIIDIRSSSAAKMGARLSQPRGAGGTTESSPATSAPPPPTPKRPFPRTINSRTIVAPAAAFTMACLLFVYARTSIRAAKENAKRYREADSGGEGLSLLNESRRRHGQVARLEDGKGGTVGEIGRAVREQVLGAKKKEEVAKGVVGSGRSEEDERLRALQARGLRKAGGEGG